MSNAARDKFPDERRKAGHFQELFAKLVADPCQISLYLEGVLRGKTGVVAEVLEPPVAAIPAGATSLSVNGEPLPGLDGSAGWRAIRRAQSVSEYALELDGGAGGWDAFWDDAGGGVPLSVRLSAMPFGTVLILK